MTTFTRTACAVAALLTATGASAGGLDRSGQPIAALFGEARTFELSFGAVRPSLTGEDVGAFAGTGATYDAGNSYRQIGGAFSNRVSETFSYAIIIDQPFGADIFYDANPAASALGGTFADLTSEAVTTVGRYEFGNGFSVYGGLRIQRAGGDVGLNGQAYAAGFGSGAGAQSLGGALQAAAAGGDANAAAILGSLGANAETALRGVSLNSSDPTIQGLIGQLNAAGFGGDVTTAQTTATNTSANFLASGGYRAELDNEVGYGYLVGAAYEIPDIAFRASITYNSPIEHEADTSEQFFGPLAATGTTTFETPRSVNVDLQTGIAADTLLTAGLRWAEWGSFDVIPPALGSDLANLDDSWRWSLGVGRRISDAFAVSASLSYEKAGGADTVSPLGPTDGQIGLTLGGRYTVGNVDISGGVNYTRVGDTCAGVGGQCVAEFDGNHAVGVGLRGTISF